METILKSLKEKMDKATIAFENELVSIRTGRASASLVDDVDVDYYGTKTPVNQVASISIQEGRIVVIKPFDRSTLKDIEVAINKANLGIAPQNDGTMIRLSVPSLTEERRKELTKDVAKYAENAKVAIRNIRRDGNEVVKKNKELPEDVQKDGQEKIQKMTDDYIKKIEMITIEKDKEIMKV